MSLARRGASSSTASSRTRERPAVRDIASKAPVDADTVFRIASMTKSFTAMSILKLRDQGKLSLDDLAEKYVPEMKGLAYPTTDSPRITIRHLLSHAEGFPEDNPWGDRQLADTDEQLSQMIKGGIPFSNAPGIAYEYSNYGFAILGRIVSNVSGEKYTDFVTANILKPLGMTSTTLEPSTVPANRLAHGYRWEDNQWKNEPLLVEWLVRLHGRNADVGPRPEPLCRRLPLGVAAARRTRDGADQAIVAARDAAGVAARAGVGDARSSTGAVQLNSGGYGFGLRISQSCSFRHVVAHGGGLPGFGIVMTWLPEHGVGIIAFGNLTYTGWGRVATKRSTRSRRRAV